MRLNSGAVGNPAFMTKTLPNTLLNNKEVFVEINPRTAETRLLRNGAIATLHTPRGSATVRVHFSHGVQPGVIAMPRDSVQRSPAARR